MSGWDVVCGFCSRLRKVQINVGMIGNDTMVGARDDGGDTPWPSVAVEGGDGTRDRGRRSARRIR